MALLAAGSAWPLAGTADQLIRIVIPAAVLALVSRGVLDFRVRCWAGTLGMGILIFGLWIAPDLLFLGYRHSWWFHNPLTGLARSSLAAAEQGDAAVLALRTLRAAVLVPVVEELFWRGWLMRWLIAPDFSSVPLGAYSRASFWMTAALFASEHGPYWDVGLAAGILFNWWMTRTKSLGDLFVSHAVANVCLSGYVVAAGKWEYWL
jgi:CAAX prenyl protease-like protein